MRRQLIFACILSLIVVACATTPPTTPAPNAVAVDAGLPPLLDRNLFFDDPQLSGAQISPDGRWISFRKPHNGVVNIFVKGFSEPFDAAKPLTADTKRPVRAYFWSQDSRYLLYVQDKGGDENFHIYAVDPTAAADGATGVPPSRDLTPGEKVVAAIYALPEKTPNEIIGGLNDRDPALHDVYRINLTTGERTLLIRNDQNVAQWVADLDGNVRLAYRQTPDGSNEILRVVDGRLGDPVVRCTFEETCSPIRFHKDGKLVYLTENIGAGVDLTRLSLLDPATGTITPVESDPEGQVDFGGPVFSDRTEELVATIYIGDRVRVYPKTDEFGRLWSDLRSKLPDGEIGLAAMTEDDRRMVVSVSSDVDPGSVYFFDADTGKAELLYRSRPELPSAHLAPMQPIRYRARDGVMIPAYLTIPKGAAPTNLPAVILPHGGPWARDFWGYNSFAQFLANRGYAVLNPNFRASTGYGKKFLNAGNKQWGTGIMQHDLSDAVKYLVDQGIADPKRVAIMGGSYGGYATLAGVTFTPDLYAAGVSIVGPSNLFTLLNSIPPYWGPIKNIFLLRMGNPDLPADKAQLEAQSPLFHAKNIKVPLLVVQGANDPRVKQAESDQIVIALRDLGRPVEYLVAPDEGHGFAGRENRIAMFAGIEQFLAKHLSGRHQAGMPDDIRAKLTAITVDPAKVEAPKIASGLDAAKVAPLPVIDASRIAPATLTYKTKLNLPGGREMELDLTTVYARDGAGWTITSTAKSPMGDGTDAWLLGPSLRPVSRSAKQGPATIEMKYDDRSVTGEIVAGPQKIPVKIELEAPAFGDQVAAEAAILAMPLATGYRTTFRSSEIGMQQRARFFSLAVEGEESVTVPAGTFQTYRVRLEPLDNEPGGTTMWVTRDTPRVTVKSESKLPPMMGGGTSVTELVSRK
ncbi:MAG: alpha/beta fold hydrolase [Thermoanaerobaculia bacterium]